MRVLSHSDTHYLNRHMAYCGCHERSDQSCSSMGIWHGADATKIVNSLAAHRSIWHDAGETKSWFSVLSMFCSWMGSVTFGQLPVNSLSRPLSRKLKNCSTKWQFLRKTEVNYHSSNEKWLDLAVSSQHLLRLFTVLSVHLSSLSLEFTPLLCLLQLCLSVSPRHNSRRRSLFMRVLFHSDTHHLNGDMVRCGCHEISIQRSISVWFLSSFSLYPIQLWFWWLSYSNHSLQLISIQYSVHRSDSARNRQSWNQKSFISTYNWRQARIHRHISCCHSHEALKFIASIVHRILTH